MKIGLSLSFEAGSLDGNYYAKIFDTFIKFQPYSFTKKHTTKAWNEKKHKKLIANANPTDNLIVGNKNYDIFITVETGSRNPHRLVEIVQDKELFLPSNAEIEAFITNNGFVAAYLHDEDYVQVQSTPHINNFKGRNIDLSSIANTPYKINEFRDKEYDINYNPGRKNLIGYTWILAAWKMWFGESFYKLVPKDKILSFPYAYQIKELPHDKIFVQLFEKVEESSSKENMQLQQKWRDWLEFDKLIEKYP